jgi:hypothetical protein
VGATGATGWFCGTPLFDTEPGWVIQATGRQIGFVVQIDDFGEFATEPYLVAGFKHVLFSISYMGCHPSH